MHKSTSLFLSFFFFIILYRYRTPTNRQDRSIIYAKQGENLWGWIVETFKGPYGADLTCGKV